MAHEIIPVALIGFLAGIGYLLVGAMLVTLLDDRLRFFNRLPTVLGLLVLMAWPLVVPSGFALLLARRARRGA